jgi:ParB-like chromosome segregation protein Spo0J
MIAMIMFFVEESMKKHMPSSVVHVDPGTLSPWEPIRAIYPDRTDDEWNGFVADIARRGVLVPLLVAHDGQRLVAGLQRRRAALEADIATVPVIVLPEMDDDDLLETAILDNRNRRHDTPLQRARAYKALADLYAGRQGRPRSGVARAVLGTTRAVLSAQIGVGEGTIQRYLDLLDLDAAVQAAVDTGTMPLSWALLLKGLDTAGQQFIVLQVQDHGWNATDISREVERRTPRPDTPARAVMPTHLDPELEISATQVPDDYKHREQRSTPASQRTTNHEPVSAEQRQEVVQATRSPSPFAASYQAAMTPVTTTFLDTSSTRDLTGKISITLDDDAGPVTVDAEHLILLPYEVRMYLYVQLGAALDD